MLTNQIFPIFGASNPALGSVPLIVILLITAVKDGIEDYRRTVLDDELNNTSIHLLVDLENGNVTDDHISTWRRIKKATSRGIRRFMKFYKLQKNKRTKKGKAKLIADANELERTQTRASVYTVGSTQESIQMTPVSSPLANKHFSFIDGVPTEVTERSQRLEVPDGSAYTKPKPPTRFRGSVIDPHIQAPGKAKFKKDYWKNVRVGDFVRIYNDEEIPADVIILSTSDSDGACYVETKNLDGETNLKVRHALHCGKSIKHVCQEFKGIVKNGSAESPKLSTTANCQGAQSKAIPAC